MPILYAVTTIVFSVTGMNVLTFTAAAILSLPKQFATVYIGHVLKEENNGKQNFKPYMYIADTELSLL